MNFIVNQEDNCFFDRYGKYCRIIKKKKGNKIVKLKCSSTEVSYFTVGKIYPVWIEEPTRWECVKDDEGDSMYLTEYKGHIIVKLGKSIVIFEEVK